LPAPILNGEEDGLQKNLKISDFEGRVTLTLDWVTWHTIT